MVQINFVNIGGLIFPEQITIFPYFESQALNNLQSTHQGFGMVTSENVFKVSYCSLCVNGTPPA